MDDPYDIKFSGAGYIMHRQADVSNWSSWNEYGQVTLGPYNAETLGAITAF